LFIVSGNGKIQSNDWSTLLSALKTIALQPGIYASCTLTASSIENDIENDIHLLELIITGIAVDSSAVVESAARKALPFALDYKDASTYRESFKSEKTISRTLIPKGLIPRFAAGSVQVNGPVKLENIHIQCWNNIF
jgi:hypothetical protein